MGFGDFLGSIGGSLVEGLFGMQQADDARDFLSAQRATAYQVATRDMKKAGLNPILAYGSGGGAPTTSAPMAQTPNVSQGINNALALRKQAAEIAAIQAAANVSNEQARKLAAEKRIVDVEASNAEDAGFKGGPTDFLRHVYGKVKTNASTSHPVDDYFDRLNSNEAKAARQKLLDMLPFKK